MPWLQPMQQNLYSAIGESTLLWEQEVRGSNPRIPTEVTCQFNTGSNRTNPYKIPNSY